MRKTASSAEECTFLVGRGGGGERGGESEREGERKGFQEEEREKRNKPVWVGLVTAALRV